MTVWAPATGVLARLPPISNSENVPRHNTPRPALWIAFAQAAVNCSTVRGFGLLPRAMKSTLLFMGTENAMWVVCSDLSDATIVAMVASLGWLLTTSLASFMTSTLRYGRGACVEVTAAVGVALVVVDVGVAFAPPLSVAVAVDVLVALLDGLVAAAVGVGVGALLP